MRLLLLSNSRNPEAGYLDHAEEGILDLFGRVRRLLFVPFALHDQKGYARRARERFAPLGIDVSRLAEDDDARRAVETAAGIFVGGGNTFRLLERLQRWDLIEPIRKRVHDGMPYMGSSAGTVIAAPTLKTTNDMPIVQPRTFESLGLVPFQINCHYLDPDPSSRHMGETRELRITEFLEENDVPVVGLREGAMLSVTRGDGGETNIQLLGTAGARIFRRSVEPVEHVAPDRLDFLAQR